MNEQIVYGMSKKNIHDLYINSFTAEAVGLEMVVMGILSDAQELAATRQRGDSDAVRQQLNVAKYILSHMMMSKEAA